MFTEVKDKVECFGKGVESVKGVLHIGANLGQEYQNYVDMNIKNILMFEPLKHIYDKLIENVPAEMCVNLALGSESDEVEMYVTERNDGMSSSILKPKIHLQMYPNITFTKKEIVKVVRLDDYLDNKPDYNLINMDVQGYELEVLKGAVQTLKHIDYINLELNAVEMYEGCPHYSAIDNFLDGFGFVRKIFEMESRQAWGDGFYVKEK